MKKLFTGVCTALITPFNKHNDVDYVALGRLIKNQIDSGVDALLILGTTGEAPTLSLDEKKSIINFTIEIVAKRVPVVVGIGGNNPSSIIELGLYAKSVGADAVMVTAPYYNKATQDGMVKFFNHIAKNVQLPMIVYNVPGRCSVNILPETMERIAKNKLVYGIKEASGNIEQIQTIVRLCPNTAVYSGDDTIALPCYAVGCVGIISVASNARPAAVASIHKNFIARKVTTARRRYFEHLPYFQSLFSQVNPIPIKHELSKMGICKNILRLPLTPFDTNR